MEEKLTVIERTSQRKVLELPAVMTKIYQPNRITNAQLPMSLTQSKIFAYVMLQLQNPIKSIMGGRSISQLDLFTNDNVVKIAISLKEIGSSASQYRDIKLAINKLAAIVVAVPYKDAQGKKMQRITGLIRADIPDKADYNSTIEIEIEKKIAEVLIKIDKNDQDLPINYTSFYYEIVLRSKSVYTARLYPLISSWARKGSFTVSLEYLKEFLCISDKYPRYYDFIKNVLEPVQDDVFEKADCWFNCKIKGFKTVRKKQIILNFKIITPSFKKELEKREEQILNMLKVNYAFTPAQLKKVAVIFKNHENNHKLINRKIISVDEFIYHNNKDTDKDRIEDKANYMLRSLISQFG